MSDDTKTVNQNTNVQFPSQPVQAPTGSGVRSPVGSPNKELGPISEDTTQLNELSPSGAEVNHKISQELKNIGVQETEDRPDLTEDHKQAGINHAGASIPPQTAPTGLIELPLTREEAFAEVKGKKPNDSGWGLGKLVLKVLKVMGIAGI